MKLVVFPTEVIPFDDFSAEWRSDDYTVVDLDDISTAVKVDLNNHQTPRGWHLFKMHTTPMSEVLDNENPITTRTFEVPVTANGNTFTAIAEVTYCHIYHTLEVEWWPSIDEYNADH